MKNKAIILAGALALLASCIGSPQPATLQQEQTRWQQQALADSAAWAQELQLQEIEQATEPAPCRTCWQYGY